MAGRCRACDAILSEKEMKRKHAITGEYMDLCTRCLREVIQIVEIPFDGEPVYRYDVMDEAQDNAIS